jgi:hypothetical protein
MALSVDRAYEMTRQLYDDEVMIEEKRRVYRMLHRKTAGLLELIGCSQALSPYNDKMKAYKQFVHIPGESIFASMQYLFNIARGDREADTSITKLHVARIYDALFTPAGLTNPDIPSMFWQTPLGLACLIGEKGIEAAFPLLEQMEKEE